MDIFTLKILRLQNPKNLNMLKVKTLVLQNPTTLNMFTLKTLDYTTSAFFHTFGFAT